MEHTVGTLPPGLGAGWTFKKAGRPVFELLAAVLAPPEFRVTVGGRFLRCGGQRSAFCLGVELEAGYRKPLQGYGEGAAYEGYDMSLFEPEHGMHGAVRLGLSWFPAPFLELRLDPVGVLAGGAFVPDAERSAAIIAYSPTLNLGVRL